MDRSLAVMACIVAGLGGTAGQLGWAILALLIGDKEKATKYVAEHILICDAVERLQYVFRPDDVLVDIEVSEEWIRAKIDRGNGVIIPLEVNLAAALPEGIQQYFEALV